MTLGGFQKTTLIDFPGKIAATVFTSGCSFRCPWCYSPELVLPSEIKKHPKLPEKEFFKFLKERRKLLDGLVLCGGEPTINKDLPAFIKKIKKLGFLVKLDTNGSNPEMLKKLINEKLNDYVAMDLKAPLGLKSQFPMREESSAFFFRLVSPSRNSASNFQTNSKSQTSKYEKATGIKVDLNKIKKSIEIIKNSGIDYEFRSTIVPTVHTKEDVIEMAKWIKGAKRYYLQNFRPEKTIDPKFEKIKPYPKEFLIEIQKIISPFFEICQIR